MKKFHLLLFTLINSIFVSNISAQDVELNITVANNLSKLPLKCMQKEYPNKLNQLLNDSSELLSPIQLHPAFYGCFDWHSSVHGHWSLVFLLNKFPALENRKEIIQKLQINLSKTNIQGEIDYLNKKHEKSFERTYGWAWLLKLQLELEKSNQEYARELAENLRPLSNLIIQRYIEFLPKLVYPQRVGTHSNTAFGLSLAYEYAQLSKNDSLMLSIQSNAKRFSQTT
jgi:hypothetical protein